MHTNVGSDAGYLPLVSPTGMGLAHAHLVASVYLKWYLTQCSLFALIARSLVNSTPPRPLAQVGARAMANRLA